LRLLPWSKVDSQTVEIVQAVQIVQVIQGTEKGTFKFFLLNKLSPPESQYAEKRTDGRSVKKEGIKAVQLFG